MALSTVPSCMAQAGMVSVTDAQSAQMQAFINGISDLVYHQLHRNFDVRTYTEFYSGDGSPFILLRQYPVISVTSICEDPEGNFGQTAGGFDSSLNLVQGVDWVLMAGQNGIGSSGMIRRIKGAWWARHTRELGIVSNLPPLPSGNIKIVYTAGYSPIPYAIQMAVNSAVMRAMATAAAGGAAQSMSYEDATMTYVSPADLAMIFGTIESTLGSYKAIVI
jgi:hypothetical protein